MKSFFRFLFGKFFYGNYNYRMKMYHLIHVAGILVGTVILIYTMILGNSLQVVLITAFSCGILLMSHFFISDINASREEAIRLSEEKNAFLSNMSHEIRTPINVMLGMTEMILRDCRDVSASEYARKIQNAGKMLQMLVSNILDVSKIEVGRFELVEDRYRTSDLIRELSEIGSEITRSCGLAFIVKVDNRLPTELWGDMPRLKQIVSNFLSNAVKYTKAGLVILEFDRKESENENQTVLLISVKDTGVGIRKEDVPVLFNAFTRLGLPSQRNIDGTGLGLAIAKQLTERMNGQICVESEYGSGSVFWVEIPQRIMDGNPMGDWKHNCNEDVRPSEESFTAPDARILVVDDSIDNLQTIEALLRRTMMRVDLAQSGLQCLEAARKTNYHIILMDHMMPDMDGIETFRRLRAENPNFNTPVIALTANAISGSESKFLAEGFMAYITKPVQVRKLEETLLAGLALACVPVTKRSIDAQTLVTSELKEKLKRDLESYGVSLEEGLKNSSGNFPVLIRMAELFVRNYPASLSEMQNASLDVPHEYERLCYFAHSLKSVAGFVGASGLSSIAEIIEKACLDSDSQTIETGLPFLYLKWDRANIALASFVERIRAIGSEAEQKAELISEQILEPQRFHPNMLVEYIERKARRKATQELDLLMSEKGADCFPDLLEAKQSIQQLDFGRARHILEEIGIWR